MFANTLKLHESSALRESLRLAKSVFSLPTIPAPALDGCPGRRLFRWTEAAVFHPVYRAPGLEARYSIHRDALIDLTNFREDPQIDPVRPGKCRHEIQAHTERPEFDLKTLGSRGHHG